MAKAPDISRLVPDLEKALSRARSNAAAIIMQDLEVKGPYWTGHFAKNWKADVNPIKPIKPSPIRERHRKKNGKFSDEFIPDGKPRRALKLKRVKPFSILDNPKIYVGNQTTYAGFAINNPFGATIPVRGSYRGRGKTYDEHIASVKGRRSTAPDGVQWYQIYLASVSINNALAVGLSEAERVPMYKSVNTITGIQNLRRGSKKSFISFD